jgi:hypothetical protein
MAGDPTRRKGPAAPAARLEHQVASTPGRAPGYRGTMAIPAPLPDVVLVTKADCHLCADARDAVGRVTAALGLGWSERSIDDDDVLRERYAEEIPVLLVDGVQRDFWRIDEVRLARTLRRALGQSA